MRQGWKFRLLALLMLAIVWILVVPNVDLGPATPLNLEAFFFVAVAVCVLLDGREFLRNLLRNFCTRSSYPSDGATVADLTSQVSPLRC